MSGIDQALLFTRSSPKLARADDWDKWEVDKHMYDLVRGPGVTSSTMYRRLSDPRLPQALSARGRRAVAYRAPDLDRMRQWLNSETLKEAVADGRTWIDAYDPLEDQWFTGNVYDQIESFGVPHLDSDILAERFEVPQSLTAEFEGWFGSYARRFAELDGVDAIQSFRVVRDISNELYLSQGNYALVVSMVVGADSVGHLISAGAHALFREAQDWELRFPYQARELFTPGGHMFAPNSDGR